MELPTALVLGATLVAEAALAALLAGSGRSGGRAFWPPPRIPSWQWWTAAGLKAVALSGIVLLGLLEWGPGALSRPTRVAGGALLVAGGEALALWSVLTLGLRNAAGAMEELEVRGPYRVLRHPEYVGESALLVGWLVLSAAPALALATPPLLACLALAARAEERALRSRFDAAYIEWVGRLEGLLGSGGYRGSPAGDPESNRRTPERWLERQGDPRPAQGP